MIVINQTDQSMDINATSLNKDSIIEVYETNLSPQGKEELSTSIDVNRQSPNLKPKTQGSMQEKAKADPNFFISRFNSRGRITKKTKINRKTIGKSMVVLQTASKI